MWAPDDIIGLIVVLAILVVPALAFTARFALKPMVESMLRIRDSLDRERAPADNPRLTALEERVAGMQEMLDRVVETVEFDAHLRAGRGARPPLPAGPGIGPRLVHPGAGPAQRPPRSPEAPPPPVADAADYEEEYQ